MLKNWYQSVEGQSTRLNIGIIGLGKAGSRFHRAILHLTNKYPFISSVVSYDRSILAEKTETIHGDVKVEYRPSLPSYSSCSNLDLICLCTNEKDHFSTLKELSLIPKKRVLSEKPLTENYIQAQEIASLFLNHEISVNFVERFSPIVSDFKSFRDSQSLEIVKIEFFWGKNRVNDPRPTMGDFSEISHALDLSLVLSSLEESEPITLLGCLGSSSNFSQFHDNLNDSIDCQFRLDDRILLTGHSSFMWGERRREILIYMRCPRSRQLFLASLYFDRPTWDCDQLIIHQLTEGGSRELVYESKYTSDDYDPELLKIGKVAQFIERNIRSHILETDDPLLPMLNDAVIIQRLLRDLQMSLDSGDSCASVVI